MNRRQTLAHAKDVKIIRQKVIDDLTKSLPERQLIAEKLLREGEQRLRDDLKAMQNNYNSTWYRRLRNRFFEKGV